MRPALVAIGTTIALVLSIISLMRDPCAGVDRAATRTGGDVQARGEPAMGLAPTSPDALGPPVLSGAGPGIPDRVLSLERGLDDAKQAARQIQDTLNAVDLSWREPVRPAADDLVRDDIEGGGRVQGYYQRVPLPPAIRSVVSVERWSGDGWTLWKPWFQDSSDLLIRVHAIPLGQQVPAIGEPAVQAWWRITARAAQR